jgi:hypothetical protein
MTENEAPWWTKLEGLPSLMKALAQARAEMYKAGEQVTRSEALLQGTGEYKLLQVCKSALADAQTRAESITALAKEEALKDFKANGEKAVYAGVSVKMYTRYDYDASQMTTWARQNLPSMLMLDVKRMEKAAAAGVLENAPIVISKEPRAIITSDLTSYLA